MKNSIKVLVLFAFSLATIFSSCSKEDASSKDDMDMLKSAAFDEATLAIYGSGDYEKVITKPLVKLDDCKYIVEGTIEFRKGNEIFGSIDFGNGTCDDIATKTVGDKSTEFSLKKEGDKDWYYKVVTEPIIKIEHCDYIVAGVIDFYSKKDNSWLATMDFGDGTCDEWAVKITNEGSYEFSMDNWDPK